MTYTIGNISKLLCIFLDIGKSYYIHISWHCLGLHTRRNYHLLHNRFGSLVITVNILAFTTKIFRVRSHTPKITTTIVKTC